MNKRSVENTLIDDRIFTSPVYSEVCNSCQHYTDGKTCLAFPAQIPEVIWKGINKHNVPFTGDKGITYKRNSNIKIK